MDDVAPEALRSVEQFHRYCLRIGQIDRGLARFGQQRALHADQRERGDRGIDLREVGYVQAVAFDDEVLGHDIEREEEAVLAREHNPGEADVLGLAEQLQPLGRVRHGRNRLSERRCATVQAFIAERKQFAEFRPRPDRALAAGEERAHRPHHELGIYQNIRAK